MSESEERATLKPATRGRIGGVGRILVCLDCSPVSEGILPYAVSLARAYEGELTLVHVLECHGRASERSPTDTLDWEIKRAEAEEYVDRIARENRSEGLEVKTMVLQGHPAEQILCLSDRDDFDLIVLSSHGEKGVTEWGLSSMADKIVQRSRSSALIIPASWSVSREATEPFSRVLVLLDGSARAEAVLPPLQRLARFHSSSFTLLHVIPEPDLLRAGPPSVEDTELLRNLANRNERAAGQYLSRVRDRFSTDQCPSTGLVEHGDVRIVLEHVVEREGIDLIAFTAHGATGNRRWCHGTVADHLIHHATTPILMIQNLPQRRSDFAGAVLHVRSVEPLRGRSRIGAR